MSKAMLRTLSGEVQARPPLWLMRQAGRYLPEYRALRAEKGSFLDLVYDSKSAAEVTLQPLRRFGFDAAILFSDILVVPHAMGQNLSFSAGEGPRLSPRLLDTKLDALTAAPQYFPKIIDTVRHVRKAIDTDKDIDKDTTLLGFAGSPWTVATYMLAGQGSRAQEEAREFAYRDQQAMQILIDAIVAQTLDYLVAQVEAGVEAVQIFDSWAGSLAPAQFNRWVVEATAKLISDLRARVPHVKIIGFAKGAGEKLTTYQRETKVDAIALDETIDLHWATRNFAEDIPLQGNLDPLALLAGGDALKSAVTDILIIFQGRPHIFNLGHGILPTTPIAHVEQLIHLVCDR